MEAMRQFLQTSSLCIATTSLMDCTNVIPYGFHFSHTRSIDGLNNGCPWLPRSLVSPVDYYFIDFGLSDYYPDGPETARTTEFVGQDKTVPELSDGIPYNPFEVDVYQLGNVFQELINKYPAMAGHFQALAKRMTSTADERPTVREALVHFESICALVPLSELTEKLCLRKSNRHSYISGDDDSDYELTWEQDTCRKVEEKEDSLVCDA
ncbi:hypothetical protein C8R43DRAFT_1231145 [Mycena crocata]|nr:hypothetical protein C8R43DRAFT_1231145 [Mycena crocata]